MDIEKQEQNAEAGSCVAQSVLGISYLYGYEVEVDYGKALRFLTAAARQGGSRAMLNLGIMHARGMGIPQDVPGAIRLFEAVANPADSSDAFAARIELARVYSKGLGVPVSEAKARSWYQAAIDIAKDNEESEELGEARTYLAQSNDR